MRTWLRLIVFKTEREFHMTAVASPSSIHPVTVRRGHAERRAASPQGAGGGVGGNSVAQILQDH